MIKEMKVYQFNNLSPHSLILFLSYVLMQGFQ
jgi:hypothetical protein